MNVVLEFALILTVAPFLALLWSLYRAATSRGLQQINAVVLSVATLIGLLFVLQYLLIRPFVVSADAIVVLAPAIGAMMILTGGIAVRFDTRLSKVFPIMQIVFGALFALGVPWQGI